MKRLLAICSVAMMMLVVLAASPFAVVTVNATTGNFGGGTGTETDPYQIATKEHLNNVRNYPAAYFVMTEDIVFTDEDYMFYGDYYNNGQYWEPIPEFTGYFDGDGHAVENLKIKRTWAGEQTGTNAWNTYAEYGMFASLEGTVDNLHLRNVNYQVQGQKITSGNSGMSTSVDIGGIAGTSKGTISTCSVSGTIKCTASTDYVTFQAAGIVATMPRITSDKDAALLACRNDATVEIAGASSTMTSEAGGIVCRFEGEKIENCENRGKVSVTGKKRVYAGGIASITSSWDESNHVTGCYNYGTVEAVTSGTTAAIADDVCAFASGIVCQPHYIGTIKECGNYGAITVKSVSGSAAGITATSSGSGDQLIQDCFNAGKIKAESNFSNSAASLKAAGISGGIVGDIKRCFNSGDVQADAYSYASASGISDFETGSIVNCYNTGSITASKRMTGGSAKAAGIIVNCAAEVTDCYNIGLVSGDKASGIADYVYNTGSGTGKVTGCYYLDNVSAGYNTKDSSNIVITTKCTRNQMQKQDTYSYFDFTTDWTMGTGDYPYPCLSGKGHVSDDPGEICKILGHILKEYGGKDPTCTDEGYQPYIRCQRCSYSTYQSIPANGHTMDQWEVITAADCKNAGFELPFCGVCGYKDLQNVTCDASTYPESKHNYENDKTVEYTFRYEGAEKLHLHFSSQTKTEEDYDHIYIYDGSGKSVGSYDGDELSGKTVTITGDSFKLKLKADESASYYGFSFDLITADIIDLSKGREIPKLNHMPGDAWDRDEENHWHLCEACGDPCEQAAHSGSGDWESDVDGHWRLCECGTTADEGGHDFQWIVDKEATEEETGLKHESCKICSYKRSEGTVIEKLPHTHKLVQAEGKTPNCTEGGWEPYEYCTGCNYTTYQELQPLNHKDKVNVGKEEATCTETGFEAGVYCNGCKTWLSGHETIPMQKHDYSWVIDKPATETEAGLKHEACRGCGNKRSEGTLIEKLPHTHKLVQAEGKTPTCTEKGWEPYEYCTGCNYTTYQELQPLNHKDKVNVGKEDATCTETGFEAGVYCNGCKTWLSGHETIPMQKHDYSWVIDKPATETEAGLKHEACRGCGNKRSEGTVINKLPHTHKLKQAAKKAATCTEKGWDAYTYCETCSYTTYKEIAAKGHDYAEKWTANGKQHWHVCVCGAKGSVNDHDFKWVVEKEATEDATGLKYQLCKVCGYRDSEDTVIDKLEHVHHAENSVLKAATTKTAGFVEEVCRCGEVLSVKSIARIGTVKLSFKKAAYNGKSKNPSLIIKDADGKKIASESYEVTIPKSRKNVGTYTYKIAFCGNYTGTEKLTLTIIPQKTAITSVKPAKKMITVKWKKVSKQVTGYEVMYSTSKSFKKGKQTKTVTIKSYKTTSKKIQKLKAKTRYYVKIRTYKTVKVNGKSKKIYGDWTKVKTVRTK